MEERRLEGGKQAVGHKCRCHLWWTGNTLIFFPLLLFFNVVFGAGSDCSERMTNIPYKPLSERMLEEPFWLGLITVVIVLIVLGICYLIKKHLPDRIEKFLLDDPEHGKLVERSNALHREGARKLIFYVVIVGYDVINKS